MINQSMLPDMFRSSDHHLQTLMFPVPESIKLPGCPLNHSDSQCASWSHPDARQLTPLLQPTDRQETKERAENRYQSRTAKSFWAQSPDASTISTMTRPSIPSISLQTSWRLYSAPRGGRSDRTGLEAVPKPNKLPIQDASPKNTLPSNPCLPRNNQPETRPLRCVTVFAQDSVSPVNPRERREKTSPSDRVSKFYGNVSVCATLQ